MKSRVQLTAAGAFLLCVAAFIIYLSMAPEYAPPSASADVPEASAPRPAPAPPTPPARVETPTPEPVSPQPPPEPDPQPEPAAPEPAAENKITEYGSVEGMVTRMTVPVPRVKITATPDAESGDTTAVTANTDTRGKFKLSRVPVGRAKLHVTNAGTQGELLQDVLVNKDQTATVEIKLPGETATLQGFIHSGGVGLPAIIEITMHGDGMDQTKKVTTNDGRFVVDNLLPGVIDFIATAEHPPGERKVRTDSFALQPGEVMQKDYSFSEPSFITGRVTGCEQDERTYVIALNGAVEPEQSFTSPDEVADRLAKMTGPAKDGTFTLENLEPGTYTVIIFSMRMQEDGVTPVYKSTNQVVELGDEQTLNVELAIKW